MATTIFYNGRLTSIPGSYSQVDASGLEQVGLGASGIVAVLGTAVGGKPANEMEGPGDFHRLTRPEQVNGLFESGDLKEAIPFIFAPSSDGEIQAGAQEIVAMKVNPATQSTATLNNAQGAAIDLTSVDYGARTAQISISIANGTNQGKLVTITFEDVTLPGDDIGGSNMFTLQYADGGTDGWDTAVAEVTSAGALTVDATRGVAGLDSDLLTTLAANRAVQVHSANGADVGQTVRVYGLSAAGAVQYEDIVLNGSTPVAGALVFGAGDVFGAEIIGTTAGQVTIEDSGGTNDDILAIAAGTNESTGLHRGSGMFVSGSVVSLALDAAGTPDVILVGTSNTGAVLREKVTLTGATPVNTVGTFTTITAIVVGDVAAARTLTISAEAAATTPSVHNTLQKMADYYNARRVTGGGAFTFTMVTAETLFDPTNLDVSLSASTIIGAALGFKADLYAVVEWINDNAGTTYMTAEIANGATGGAPTNTTSPVFLQGGEEGTTLASHWEAALDLLKQTRVNSVVVLTGDPAIHADVEAHCAYMCGAGRSERDGFVGIQNAGLTDVPTKTEIKSAIQNLNSRHIRACAQAVERFSAEGVRTEYQPPFLAGILAGMQAGSAVGTSLTNKYVNVLSFRQDSSWNPTDDAEEMIQAGLVFLESVEGRGRRVVRNVTTFLQTNNLAFTEGSVNEAANFSAFTLRTAMEFAVGRKGFAGTVNAAKGVAVNNLGLLVDAEILVAWRSLDISLAADVMELSVETAPVIPINFVKNNIHLVTQVLRAA